MRLFRWWLRWKQSRGHGVHSPFAFDLITDVFSDRHTFYAFHDLPLLFEASDLAEYAKPYFNRLSFRLILYFKAKRILEVNAFNGVNTSYLLAPSSDIHCTCVVCEDNLNLTDIVKLLPEDAKSRCELVKALPAANSEPFDAIFINLKEGEAIPESMINYLLQVSNENTFWVIHPINGKENKQFWTSIVKEERFPITFDRKKTGIAFLRPSYYKMHYWI